MNEQLSSSNELTDADPEHFLKCVACGYNLFGLGDEPRCPECGLLNVPEVYRKQVHELVDSGKWFYSGFFSPFKKRLPGWWWSLDREGDVRKSFRYAAINLLLSAMIILLFGGVVGLIHVETRTYVLYRMKDDPLGTIRKDRYFYNTTTIHYHGEQWGNVEPSQSPGNESTEDDEILTGFSTSLHLVIRPSWIFLLDCIPWIFLIWCVGFIPVYVGLFTQVRKGLPEYARPTRTILAAGNFESFRLIYLAILVCLGQILYLAAAYVLHQGNSTSGPQRLFATSALFFLLFLLGVLGWVGPLRSDPTKQLVRSRWHAFRIIVMYVLILPLLCHATISGVIHLLIID